MAPVSATPNEDLGRPIFGDATFHFRNPFDGVRSQLESARSRLTAPDMKASRELSLVLTKIDEALLWLTKVAAGT